MTEQKNQLYDVNSKRIFGNHELCAQFLRDYADIPLLKNVRAEDIEDVTERYHVYEGIEHSSDTVKRIKIDTATESASKTPQLNMPIYVISLVDHKSTVDYNVSMQLLRYMVGIWSDWETEMREKNRSSRDKKDFKYPPIIPIVYYDGIKEWTADLHLKDRVFLSELFGAYIPDFTYKIIRNRDYSNEELLANEDEMSLLMLLNKVRQSEDFEMLRSVSPELVNRIVQGSSENVLEIIISTVWSLCRKLNLSEVETENYVQKVRERRMGYWFDGMEPMDIQEERRKTAEAKKELETVRQQVNEAKEMVDAVTEEINDMTEQVNDMTKQVNVMTKRAKAAAERAKEEAERAKAAAKRAKVEAERANTEAERANTEAERANTEANRANVAVRVLTDTLREKGLSEDEINYVLEEKGLL